MVTNTASTKKNIAALFAIILWFAVVAQFYLIIVNRTASIAETILNFFSFFTVLTNGFAAIYFTSQALGKPGFSKPGILTAITVYITIVGMVYQVLLRHTWQPTGFQKVVDELLHSVDPLLVIIYWYFFEIKKQVAYRQIPGWLIYPLAYLIFIMIRGVLTNTYPYPFIDVAEIGLGRSIFNAVLLLAFFYAISCAFIFAGRLISKK